MLHLLITILVITGLIVAASVANVFVSALLLGVAHECYKRAYAVSAAITGKSADQR